MLYNPGTQYDEFVKSDLAVSVQNLSKMYPMYNSPRDRLKQQIFRDRKYFDEFWAIKDVSFNLRKGESRGILGHNGAGKSTLLYILAGTLTPTLGNVYIRGRVGAIMTMGSGFKLDFTGRENVYVLGALMGVGKPEINGQMDRIREFAGIGMFFDKPVRTYSSGMLARLAFAVYTCLEPDILIVDEVINVGDTAFKKKCMVHVRELVDRGMSLLLVSHSPPIVKDFCDRATVLEKGRLIYDGDVAEGLKLYNETKP